MPRKPEGDHPLTSAQKMARQRAKQKARMAQLEAENAALREEIERLTTSVEKVTARSRNKLKAL